MVMCRKTLDLMVIEISLLASNFCAPSQDGIVRECLQSKPPYGFAAARFLLFFQLLGNPAEKPFYGGTLSA
jgi:hypothetical protein